MMASLTEFRFAQSQLSTKPGPGGKRLTYVDIRHIQAALDELAPGWSSRLTLDGNRAICELTLDGITRADVGEGDTVFDASNQAFRRAAAAHGVGRYLWLDGPQATQVPKATVARQTPTCAVVSQPRTDVSTNGDNPFTDPAAGATAQMEVPMLETTRKRLHAVGCQVYGDGWKDKRAVLVAPFGHTSSNELTEAQARRLIVGMQQLQQQQNGVHA